MSEKMEKLTPQELGLETKEGRIIKKGEAIDQADAGKPFRDAALAKELSEKAKTALIKQAEIAENEAGQIWRKEKEKELLKEYEEKRKEELILEPEIAEAMARVEQQYHLAAKTEGLSEKDKKAILKKGEEDSWKLFQTVAPQRLKSLKEEDATLTKEYKELSDRKGYSSQEHFTAPLESIRRKQNNIRTIYHNLASHLKKFNPTEFSKEE